MYKTSFILIFTFFQFLLFNSCTKKVKLDDNQNLVSKRDALLWPFAATSIWNMPIGSGAVYKAANLELPANRMLTLD